MNLRFALAAVVVLVAGACSHAPEPRADFRAAAESINATIRANHYHPAELDNAAYRRIENDVVELGSTAASGEEFRIGFNALWRDGPFSHVALLRAEETTAERYARLDEQPAGEDAVTLAWQRGAAILAVNTMSGPDTIERIEAAYDEIAARGAERLIIDLRRNTGGAFAVVPLVGHLIEQPVDAGVFVTGAWYRDHEEPPDAADFASATPWRGYSVREFQTAMLSRPLTSYRIDPMPPTYRGPVYVLTSARSISAAEIAADVLKSSGRATLIGEKTPGVVLSSKRFDIPGGFHLMVPIADYLSARNVRLEGSGVTPDVPVEAGLALEIALGMQLEQRALGGAE